MAYRFRFIVISTATRGHSEELNYRELGRDDDRNCSYISVTLSSDPEFKDLECRRRHITMRITSMTSTTRASGLGVAAVTLLAVCVSFPQAQADDQEAEQITAGKPDVTNAVLRTATIYVKNWDASLRFYSQHLGYSILVEPRSFGGIFRPLSSARQECCNPNAGSRI